VTKGDDDKWVDAHSSVINIEDGEDDECGIKLAAEV